MRGQIYGSVAGSLALLARRADRATSSDVAKHPPSEAGGGSNSTEYSGTGPTTPPHDAKDASRNFLCRGLPLLARRGSLFPTRCRYRSVAWPGGALHHA